MATVPKINKDTKIDSLESSKTISFRTDKKMSSSIQPITIIDPIKSARVSRIFPANLTTKSVLKAGLVFFTTIGAYYLAKTTNIFSYFKKEKNSKDADSNEIMKIKNTLNIKTNLETENQTNDPSISQIKQTYKDDKTIEFEEIKVEEFKDLSKVEENVVERRSVGRRSISIKNPISNQNATVGMPFNLTIDGTYVFNSTTSLFLEVMNILPSWLNSLNLNSTLKGLYKFKKGILEISILENYVYTLDSHAWLWIIDVSDPSNPTLKGSYDTPGQAFGVAVSGNYAYAAGGYTGLQIIDISDPSNPTFKSSYDTHGDAFGVALFRNYAYLADGASGLYIIASNLNKVMLSGTPNFVGIYSIDIKACNEEKECAIDSFDIIVKDFPSPDVTPTLIIISSITAGAICVTSFCCLLIIGGGIVALNRYRNRDKSNTNAKMHQKSESTIFLINDTEIEKNYHTLKENPQFLNMI